MFKFAEPEFTNGQLTSFNLYQINECVELSRRLYLDHELQLIYSGLNREYVHVNLQPFKNYSFLYEACTNMACTRQTTPTTVQTPESAPEQQQKPLVQRLTSNLNCFKLNWALPVRPNGIIRFFEVYRLGRLIEQLNFTVVDLILNQTLTQGMETFDNYTYVDCDLAANYLYSYQVIAYNARGNAPSGYTRPVVSNQSLPEGFSKIKLVQLNESLVQIDWSRPKFSYGLIMAYNIYRNFTFVTNSSQIRDFETISQLTYFDIFDFLPNSLYRYCYLFNFP